LDRNNISLYTGSSPVDLSKLPAPARQKVEKLISSAEDGRLVARNLAERMADLGERRREAQTALERVSSTGSVVARRLSSHEISVMPGRQDAIDRAAAEVAKITAEFDALQARSDRSRARISNLPSRIIDWIERLPVDAVLLDHPMPIPVLPPGRSAAEAISECRDQISVLRADLHQIDSAIFPAEVVRQRFRQQLNALAERGRPGVLHALETGNPVRFATLLFPAQNYGGSIEVEDAAGLLAWACRDQILAAVDAEISAMQDDENALTESQRNERMADVLEQILDIERQEERIGELIEAAGGDYIRRADADIRAVLCVEVR
jgi:hypothetical protein